MCRLVTEQRRSDCRLSLSSLQRLPAHQIRCSSATYRASRCSSWAVAEGRAPARAGAATGSGGGRLMSDYVCITAIGICHASAKLLTRQGGKTERWIIEKCFIWLLKLDGAVDCFFLTYQMRFFSPGTKENVPLIFFFNLFITALQSSNNMLASI